MKRSLPLLLSGLLPLQVAAALPLRAQEFVVDAPVRWEPVVETETAPTLQADPSNRPAQVVWELVPEGNSSGIKQANPAERYHQVVWELVPNNPQLANTPEGAGSGESNSTQVVWEVIPGSVNPLAPTPSGTLAKDQPSDPTAPPADAVAFEQSQPQHRIPPPPPPPPPLQALNRSIAFGDGTVGPDISLRIPNGFRWSQRWFGDVSILGYDYQNGRNPGDPFIPARNSGNLDGVGIIHANILQSTNWSIALNTSFRSLQNNPDIPGGSTGIEDGLSSGFRIARAIGNTGGIAFGGEQVIQWDDNTDTGRNLYLMASNGWWLGDNGKNYPLFIANGGFGTGRFATLTDKDEPFHFTCTPVESNRKVAKVDENLCWGPIGSVSLVFNEWWGTFVDYAIGRATLGVSANLTGGIPLRVTAGIHIVENNEFVSFDQLRWITQLSIGF